MAEQAQVLELQALERISAVLLPHQSEKLNSVVSWIAVSKYGLLFLADQVAEQLKVTPTAEQRKAIQDTQEKLDREFHEYCLGEYRSLISRIADKFPMYREYTEQLNESATMVWIDFLLADEQNLENMSPDLLGSTLADLVKGIRTASLESC